MNKSIILGNLDCMPSSVRLTYLNNLYLTAANEKDEQMILEMIERLKNNF